MDPDRGVGFAHVIKVLEVVRKKSSFASWVVAMQAARHTGAKVNWGNDGRQVCRQLVACCAGQERFNTMLLCETLQLVAWRRMRGTRNLLFCAGWSCGRSRGLSMRAFPPECGLSFREAHLGWLSAP